MSLTDMDSRVPCPRCKKRVISLVAFSDAPPVCEACALELGYDPAEEEE